MGTSDASAFSDKVGKDGDRDILFNGPGDGAKHGHIVEDPQGKVKYARDVEGTEYNVSGQQPPVGGASSAMNANGY